MRALADELSAPLGFVLEGGYDLRALAASVAATMTAARDGKPTGVPAGVIAQRARAHYAQWWPALAD
jgi:acetoin utilization deacetylase AcuC-like enzyme